MKLDLVTFVILVVIIFLAGVLIGYTICENTEVKKLKEGIDREYRYARQCKKDRDRMTDKFIDEIDKNKLYKLWIYEQIRDKRSD